MADPSPTDPTFIPPATRTRTLAHMNKDHQNDLQHMLQHYNGVSAAEASSNPTLVDMDLSSLTVTTGDLGSKTKTHTVHISPPMAAWNDRRQRLVDMTLAARAALGVVVVSDDSSDHNASGSVPLVTKYHSPGPADVLVAALVAFYFASFGLSHYSSVFEHPLVRDTLDAYWRLPGFLGPGAEALGGGGVQGFQWLVDLISWPVLAIHLTETWLMHRTRLSRYGVKTGSAVWWKWVVSTFFEGYMAFLRIDRVVEEEERRRKKA